MTQFKKIMSTVLAVSVVMGLTACDDSSGSGVSTVAPAITNFTSTSALTTTDPDENAATDKEIKDVTTSEYTPDGNAGKLIWLGYYDIRDSDQYAIFQTEQYGGEIEYVNCSSGDAYFEKLGVMISSGDSPDIVSYEWTSFPHGMSKNMYEPLDDYINTESPLWSGIAEIAENYAYKGKHYYYPYETKTNFALNYNRKVLQEAGLTDPYDLYMKNNWTWDTFKELMIQWCNLDDAHIGYAGCNATGIVSTTGVSMIEIERDGTIINNVKSPDVARAMQFVMTLAHDGLVYQNELGNWVSPELWATNSDRILFLGMNPDWTYTAAAAEIQNPSGVENDICNTVSDFAFVPYPRDPSSDVYSIAYDTFGYMVPKGSDNIKGAVDWIHLNRIYATDANVLATAREDAINPTPVYYVEGKYKGMQRWSVVWDPELYDLWVDMKDPSKFNLIFDDCKGFNSEMTSTMDTLLSQPMFDGASWTQLSEEYAPVIDTIIAEYQK